MAVPLRYLRMLAAACAFTLLVNYAAEHMGFRWLNHRSDDLGEYSVLPVYQHFRVSPDVVFVGSSHTSWGVLPSVAQELLAEELGRPAEVWNLGLPGGLNTQLPIVLDFIFDGGVPPRVLAVEADPLYWTSWPNSETLNADMQEFVDRKKRSGPVSLKTYAQDFFYGPTALWRQVARLVSRNARQKAALQRQHGGRWRESEILRDRAAGGPTRPGVMAEQRAHPEKLRPKDFVKGPGEQQEAIMRDLLDRCRAAGTRVFFWHAPTLEDWKDARGRERDARDFKWVQAHVPPDAPLVNLDQPGFVDDSGFDDLDHLDPSGADTVTRALAPELARLLRE